VPLSTGGALDPAQPIRLWARGTNFQLQVWRALLRIPEGRLATYSDIAAAIGRPAAHRAVARAVGANPIAVLIPCHRVIRATGVIETNYRWGTPRKLALVGRELANGVR
jgi:AraC family transcriptional regulator of adaptative response/methylated-DNA-[protein]-cysteine methyltransferase